jgi:hypothetical protein
MLSLEKFFTVGFDRWRLKRVSRFAVASVVARDSR